MIGVPGENSSQWNRGINVLIIFADEYDTAVISGCFVEGHLSCSSLYEMIRIVKPGN